MKNVLFILSFAFIAFLSGCSEKSVNNTDGIVNQESAYAVVSSFVNKFDYSFDKENSKKKSFENGDAVFTPIFNKNGDTSGMLLDMNSTLRFALISKSKIMEFDVIKDKNDKFIIGDERIVFSCDKIETSVEDIIKSKGLEKRASYGVCQYVSHQGLTWACITGENWLGYYYILTTKIGDPITWDHYQWCVDWFGNTISCPLNETTYTTWNCGIAPRP